MRNFYFTALAILLLFDAFLVFNKYIAVPETAQNPVAENKTQYGAPVADEEDNYDRMRFPGFIRFPDLIGWNRPDGPLRVGLQVGHWKNNELPWELEKLRENSGASSSTPEWQVNLAIAQKTKTYLEEENIIVDIIPATIPPSYWADAFVAIHADGNTDSRVEGYKVSPPRRDYSGKAVGLAGIIENVYGNEVGFPKDPVITMNMRSYYAFSWWRYEHAIHPKTPAVILETGFLTNPYEAKILINDPEKPAKALADALIEFLK